MAITPIRDRVKFKDEFGIVHYHERFVVYPFTGLCGIWGIKNPLTDDDVTCMMCLAKEANSVSRPSR